MEFHEIFQKEKGYILFSRKQKEKRKIISYNHAKRCQLVIYRMISLKCCGCIHSQNTKRLSLFRLFQSEDNLSLFRKT